VATSERGVARPLATKSCRSSPHNRPGPSLDRRRKAVQPVVAMVTFFVVPSSSVRRVSFPRGGVVVLPELVVARSRGLGAVRDLLPEVVVERMARPTRKSRRNSTGRTARTARRESTTPRPTSSFLLFLLLSEGVSPRVGVVSGKTSERAMKSRMQYVPPRVLAQRASFCARHRKLANEESLARTTNEELYQRSTVGR